MTNLHAELKAVLEAALNLHITQQDWKKICIIDPPGHSNVGDSAILLGELDYLSRNFPSAELSFYDIQSYSADADIYIEQADIILIHGGGNFGDIWPANHDLRMRVLERFPLKRVVQMPQSIHFSDQSKLGEAARAISNHKNFTLFVRDDSSYKMAKGSFECPVYLVPDMAFAMQPIRRRLPVVDFFCLFRTDKEAVANHHEILKAMRTLGGSIRVDDWIIEHKSPTMIFDRQIGKLVKRYPNALSRFRNRIVSLRRRYAEHRLNVGLDLLSQGKVVITDRLHAHILSCLMDIPNYVFDSFDGKISSYFRTWTEAKSHSALCTTPSAMISLLEGEK